MPTVADHLFDRTTSDQIPTVKPKRPTQFGRKWNPKTPRNHITQIVTNMHVSKTDEDVRAEIQRRIDQVRMRNPAQWTASIVQQCLDFAVLVHHANQELFMRVMRGSR